MSDGVFNLLWNGRLLSDHYVSKGRFRNLLQREILMQGKQKSLPAASKPGGKVTRSRSSRSVTRTDRETGQA